MMFSSIPFLFYFLPAILLVYFGAVLLVRLVRPLVGKSKIGKTIFSIKLCNMVLFVASLIFYGWAGINYLLVILAQILAAWLWGLVINKTQGKAKKVALILSILTAISTLAYFKYTNFFIENINAIFNGEIRPLSIVVPLGISFYTFQLLSYNIDLYRGDVKVQKNPFVLATYVMLFVQVMAGPIVRYSDIIPQLEERKHSFDDFYAGVTRFTAGLGKTVFFGQSLWQFNHYLGGELSVFAFILRSFTFTLHLYFDFSGYSDMAIGLGRMFGIRIIENFDYPFIAKNITEFWRRWHISLGLWLRDYIYIPMGGNRKRQMLNVFVVWFLIGFLQGAAWNFIFWGVFFVIIIMIEKKLLNKTLPRWPRVFQHLYMIVIVVISFMFFRNYNIFQSTSLIGPLSLHYLRSYALIVVVAMIASTPIPKKIFAHKSIRWFEPIAVGICLILATSFLATGNFNPLIYARF